MVEKSDCNICKVWREAGSTLLCRKEQCKTCGSDMSGKLSFCPCRNCKYLKD